MMLAPKDPSKFIEMICIESVELRDKVWGDCSLIKGNKYKVLIEDKWFGFYLVKIGSGLCPHDCKLLKTEQEIRDEKLTEILNT